MPSKDPPFEITAPIAAAVTEIAEMVGGLGRSKSFSADLTLHRANRIRTIHGSLAIEQNTLSLAQVTAVLNGKRVLAPPREIAEVKMPMRSMSSWINWTLTRSMTCWRPMG